MKVPTIVLIGATALGLTSIALADKYDDLARNGYRWITTDGLLACRSKDNVQHVITHRGDADELQMIRQLGAYYLIRGEIVLMVQEDKASGFSQINVAGIGNLWTPTKFVSKHPITNILGTIFTPETRIAPILPTVNPSTPSATATPSAEASPGARPDSGPRQKTPEE